VTLQSRLSTRARYALMVLGLVAVFLTFGVPRFLAGDVGPSPTHTASGFDRLCRQHGGTPGTAAASATAKAEPVCTVRYGARVYRMDAITPTGFDDDTARYQKQGCQSADRERKASGGRGPSYVYHPTTGVCEHRL
jgi:hypothetical protein